MSATPHERIALIGFMGAGKSHAGRRLAGRLGWRCLDVDAEVERLDGRPISRIFAEGEAAFRALEERVALRLLGERRAVVALGGGALGSAAVRDELARSAFTVLLDVDVETAWARVAPTAQTRPLARDRAGFERLYEERRELYADSADALVDARGRLGDEPLLVPLCRPGARSRIPALLGGRRAGLVADRRVLELAGPPCRAFVTVRVAPGEAAKTVGVARQAWSRLADAGLERGDLLVGFGGGAATDLAGFVAATHLRGVPWLAVPTTFLGMVDAAIGGKTAVDLPGAKNQVGSFHQPQAVVADPDLLATLPPREWACGFAEAVKTALLAGGRLWQLVRGIEPQGADAAATLELVRRCAAEKARVVALDPRERGLRETLNLGHTIGHAVEAAAGYRGLEHGEAVAVGLVAALWLSARYAGLDPALEGEVSALLARHGLPTRAPGLDRGQVLALLRRDKKRRAGRQRFVLLEAIGRPLVGVDPGEALIEAAVDRALAT